MTEKNQQNNGYNIDEYEEIPIEYYNDMEKYNEFPEDQDGFYVDDFGLFDEPIDNSKIEYEQKEKEEENLEKESTFDKKNAEDRKKESISESRKQFESDLNKLKEAIQKKSEEIKSFDPPKEGMSQKEVAEINARKQEAIDELSKMANEWSNISDKVKNIDLEFEKSDKLGKDVKNPFKEFVNKVKDNLHNAMNKVTQMVDDIKFNLETKRDIKDIFLHKNEQVKNSFYKDISEDAKIFEEEFIKSHDFADPEINNILDEYVNVVNKYEENNKILDNLTGEKDKKISDVYDKHPNNKIAQKAKEKFEHGVAHASDVSRFEQAKMGAFIIHDALKGKGDSRIIEYNLKTDDPDKIANNINKAMNRYNKTIAMNNKLIAPKVKLIQAWAAKTSIVSGFKAYKAEQKMIKIQKEVQSRYGDKGIDDLNRMANTIRHNNNLANKGAQVAEYAKTIGVTNLSKFMKSYNEYAEVKKPTAKMQAKYEKIEAKAKEVGLNIKKTDAVIKRETKSQATNKNYSMANDVNVSKSDISKMTSKTPPGKINDISTLIKDAKRNVKNNDKKQNVKNVSKAKANKEEQEFSI